jgi:guanylate kinase
LEYAEQFDRVIVNDDLEEAVEAVRRAVTDFIAK